MQYLGCLQGEYPIQDDIVVSKLKEIQLVREIQDLESKQELLNLAEVHWNPQRAVLLLKIDLQKI